jgi:phosphoglycolate phosphatase
MERTRTVIDAVVWDWNGTLLNDVVENHRIVNDLLTRRGKAPISLVTYKKHFRMPIKDFYRDIGFNFERETFESVAKDYNELYQSQFANFRLTDGVMDAITALNARGKRQYILSASHQKDLERQVGSFNLRPYFAEIIGNDDYAVVSKIDKARAFSARIATDKILYIGDLYHDFEGARELGARCLLYANGHQEIKESAEYEIIHRISEVIGFVD